MNEKAHLAPSSVITHGPMPRAIWMMSWPNILNQALFQVPGLYDAIWLGQLGREGPAAAGLATSVRITMISVLMALSLGSGAIVARYVGAGERDRANLAVLQGILLMIFAAGSLGLIGFCFARPLMQLAGADADVLPFAVRYARILFSGLIAMELVPSIGGMLNAAGESKVMLNMTFITAAALVLFEPLMVRWWGIEGASLAMVLAHTAGALWGLIVLLSGRAAIRLDIHHLRLDWGIIKRIVRISLPAVVQRGMPNLAVSILMRLVSSYGPSALSAWVIGQRIFNMGSVPGMGLSRAAPALVGQNLGARQPDRARRFVQSIAWYTVGVSVVVYGLLIIWAGPAMSAFSNDMETIDLGRQAIRVLGMGYVIQCLVWVFDAALGGAGDTVSPMMFNLIAVWLIELPLAFALSQWTDLQLNGIWLALIATWIAMATMMIWRFRQGRWQAQTI